MRARWSSRIAVCSVVLGIAVIGIGLFNGEEFLCWWRVRRVLSHRLFDTSIVVEDASPIDPRSQLVSVGASGETYYFGERVSLDSLVERLVKDAETDACLAPILFEIESDVALTSCAPVLERVIVGEECVTLGLLVSASRGTRCVWLDVPFAERKVILRGGDRFDLADVDSFAGVLVSFSTDGDLLVLDVVTRNDVLALLVPPSPLFRVEAAVWSQLGVLRALEEHPKVSQLPVAETTFLFSVQPDPEVTIGRVAEFVTSVRSSLGDRGFVTLYAPGIVY